MDARICDICGKVFGDDGKEPHLVIIKYRDLISERTNYVKEVCTECMNKVHNILNPINKESIL